MNIEERFIPYLYRGYSNETVEALLSDLKISEVMDYDAISEKAQEIFSLQNEEIRQRNTNRSWVVKVLDTHLWALTFGFLRLLENEIDIVPLMKTAHEIRSFIQNTPLRQQTWRKDYPEVVLGRACEIKEFYASTHYVFTHGQATHLYAINTCMKELVKQFRPEFYNPLSGPFRPHNTVELTENIEAFVEKYPEIHHTFNDDELNAKTSELLSVDAYMWNDVPAESALDFLIRNTNININSVDRKNIVVNIFKGPFESYCSDNYINGIFGEKVHQIGLENRKLARVGTLYTICIPKKIVQNPETNFVYRAHAMGIKCRCHSTEQDIALLEKTQNGEKIICDEAHAIDPAQYRLLIGRLDQEKTVRTFPIHPLKKVEHQSFKKSVKNLVREFAFYAKIIHLTEKLNSEETEVLMEELKSLSALRLLDGRCLKHLVTTYPERIPSKIKEVFEEILDKGCLKEKV